MCNTFKQNVMSQKGNVSIFHTNKGYQRRWLEQLRLHTMLAGKSLTALGWSRNNRKRQWQNQRNTATVLGSRGNGQPRVIQSKGRDSLKNKVLIVPSPANRCLMQTLTNSSNPFRSCWHLHQLPPRCWAPGRKNKLLDIFKIKASIRKLDTAITFLHYTDPQFKTLKIAFIFLVKKTQTTQFHQKWSKFLSDKLK